MLTSNKKLIIIFSVIILFCVFFSKSYAIVSKTSKFYVNDSANILSNESENYIVNMNRQLEEKTGAQIVVVTVNNLENKSIEDYATELFRNYGIGNKEKNNGVLLLVAIDERKVKIEVGYGLEGKITDGKAGRILDDYVVPYFKENNWNDGIINGFNAILKEVTEEYQINIENAGLPIEYLNSENEDSLIWISAGVVYGICIIIRIFFKRVPIIKWPLGARSCSYSNCS